MRELLEASFFYRLMASLYSFLGLQWRKSKFIQGFLNKRDDKLMIQKSLSYGIGKKMKGMWQTAFYKLGLESVFRNSFLAQPYLWMFLAIIFAPLLPTMGLLLLVTLAAIALWLQMGMGKTGSILETKLQLYILLFAGFYGLAILMSVSFKESLLPGLVALVFALSGLFIQLSVRQWSRLRVIILGIVAIASLVSLYGIYQYIFNKYSGVSGAELWVDAEMFTGITNRVVGTFGNPNVFSEYLLLVIPLSLACLFASRTWPMRLLFFASSITMCLAMVLTFSRAGWLGLLFALCVFFILLDRRFILLIVLAFFSLVAFSPDVIIDRFTSIGDMSDGSTSYRVAIWQGTQAMLQDYWLTGIGPGTGTFNTIYPTYAFSGVSAQHAHNLFLQILSDGGLVLLLTFLLLLLEFVRMMASSISKQGRSRARIFQISSLASLGGFLVQSMADHTFYNYRLMFLFWIFIGLGALFCRLGNEEDIGSLEKPNSQI